MKRHLLSWASTLMLILLGLTYQAQAQGVDKHKDIKKTGDGFDIYYLGANYNVKVPGAVVDGFVSLKFRVEALRNQNIENVYFELPEDGGLISPVGFYTSGGNNGNGQGNPAKRYRVVAIKDKDLLPNGFAKYITHAVRFEAIGGKKSKSNKKASVQEFEFVLSEAEYASMSDIHVAVESSEEGKGNAPDVRSIGYVNFQKSERDLVENDKNNGKLKTASAKTITPLSCTAPAIIGNSDPCPNEIVVFTIPIKAGSTIQKITWSIPTIGSDGLPSNWKLISTDSVKTPYGYVTNKITVQVGDISGTVYASVNMGTCGTLVTSFATYLGDEIPVTISTVNGDKSGTDEETFKEGDLMIFNANANQGRDKREYYYNWVIPTGWTYYSGQGTSQLIVIAGSLEGFVEVDVQSKSMDARYCGLGYAYVELIKESGSCTGPKFEVDTPPQICEGGVYRLAVKNPDPNKKIKYQFFVPDGVEIVSQGYGYAYVKVVNVHPDSTELAFTIVAVNANNCGASDVCVKIPVGDCPTDCTAPIAPTLTVPSPLCNIRNFTFTVNNYQAGYIYDYEFPEGFFVEDLGNGQLSVDLILDESMLGVPQKLVVIATNECGRSVSYETTVTVNECDNGNPLPVTLTRFGGASRNGSVELAWSTASEINNDRFEIERSTTGKEFAKVGEVKGNGNSSVAIDYSFTDRFETSGTVYYRLKQVDYDGKFEYSRVIAVKHSAVASTSTMSVYPNPITENELSIRFQEQVKGSATVRIMDISGRVLQTQEVSNVDGEIPMNLQGLNLKAGIYMISVTANGRNTTQRIMVRQ